MKTKPLGRKLERALLLNIVSLTIGILFFFTELPFYDTVCGICAIVVFITLVRTLDLLSEGSFFEYGFWGRKKSNPFYTFEPGDPDYEKEKFYQDTYDDEDDSTDDK